MIALTSFIAFLFYFVGGYIALSLALLLILAVGVYTFKTARLLIALLNYSITEPESKIITKVQKLNKLNVANVAAGIFPDGAASQKKKKK